ncbi:alpha/beta fold hydrolase [Flavobacterium sp. F52]|uniref:alpha/beta fold hydrolase n=1 Tax=Flavobacterium sp. F52 TaxID=1202532 RepID=UPI000272D860|nr:alpha/beta fold hydrolase [Flavobacterium sp. F52]EJG03167.1 hypothetical protein FF52_03205 [Flavobacterium sp. F52]
MRNENPKTIIFITGAFVSHSVWDDYQAYFKKRGFNTYAPSWPYKDAPPEVLIKRQPDPELAGLRLEHLVDYFESYTNRFPESPYLIAEGLGGIVVEILLRKHIFKGCILINPWPAYGFCPFRLKPLYLLASIFASLQFQKTYLMPDSLWQRFFAYGRTNKNTKHYSYRVPESKMLIWDIAKRKFSSRKKTTVPCLIVATQNALVPASVQFSDFTKHYTPSKEFKAFEKCKPPALGYPPDQEMLDFIYGWIQKTIPE